MYISVADGNVKFAQYLIYVDLNINQEKLISGFQIENNGIICYHDYELDEIKNKLNELNIPYTIEPITFTEEQKNKVKGKKFNSRTEAIQYLQGEIEEPESEIIPTLKREKAELQQQLQQTEDALLTLMFGN